MNPLNKIPLDKWQHFAVGAAVAAIVFLWTSLLLSIVLVAIIALGKKLLDYWWDKREGKRPDVAEMLWDVVATLLGGVVVWAAIVGCHLHN